MAGKTTPGLEGEFTVHLLSHLNAQYTVLIPYTARCSAYLLASSALSPFYGKLSDLVGRKAVLYPVIVIFLVRPDLRP